MIGLRGLVFEVAEFVLFILEVFFAVTAHVTVWPCFVGAAMSDHTTCEQTIFGT